MVESSDSMDGSSSKESRFYRVGKGISSFVKGYRTLDDDLPPSGERFSVPFIRLMQVPPSYELHLTGPGGTLDGIKIPLVDNKILRYKAKGPGLRLIFGLGGYLRSGVLIDKRLTQIDLPNQHILTADGFGVEFDALLTGRINDGRKAAFEVAGYREMLIHNASDAVNGHLSQLEAVELKQMEGKGIDHGEYKHLFDRMGFEVSRIGIENVILPSEVEKQLSEAGMVTRLALAEKEAAQYRVDASKMYADNPIALKLRALEALENIAGRQGNFVIAGGEGLEHLVNSLLKS